MIVVNFELLRLVCCLGRVLVFAMCYLGRGFELAVLLFLAEDLS